MNPRHRRRQIRLAREPQQQQQQQQQRERERGGEEMMDERPFRKRTLQKAQNTKQ